MDRHVIANMGAELGATTSVFPSAAASAITGVITDPRTLDFPYPRFQEPELYILNTEALAPPAEDGRLVALIKGPNIASLPELDPLPDALAGPVLIKTGDNVSTDEIMPAGAKVLPLRSNIPAISKFTFYQIDEGYYDRAMQRHGAPSFIVGGVNYGQGSSREHAALAPRYLGVRAVLAKSFARIHWQNLCNFGIVPLTFEKDADYEAIRPGDQLTLPTINEEIRRGDRVTVVNTTQGATFTMRHAMTPRQVQMVLAGSILKMSRGGRGP